MVSQLYLPTKQQALLWIPGVREWVSGGLTPCRQLGPSCGAQDTVYMTIISTTGMCECHMVNYWRIYFYWLHWAAKHWNISSVQTGGHELWTLNPVLTSRPWPPAAGSFDLNLPHLEEFGYKVPYVTKPFSNHISHHSPHLHWEYPL